MPSIFSAETTLFGVGIFFQSNHAEALRCALSVFPPEACARPSGARLVHVALGTDETVQPTVERSRVDGRQLEFAGRGILVKADGASGRGTCVFPAAAVNSEAFANAIDTVVLFLVAQAGRIPVHASAIMVHERALVLAGRSGTGKSILALAADRAGLPVLSEDTVFVQLRPSFCVWGRAKSVHLSERDAPSNVPSGIRVRSGRVKRAIPIVHRLCSAGRAMLFLLTHGDRVIFRRLDPSEAVRELTRDPEAGYDFYGARSEEAIRALAAGGCWRLTLSRNPDEAIAALVGTFFTSAPSEVAEG